MSPFRRNDGSTSPTRIVMFATVVMAITGVIAVVPILATGLKTAVSPWTSLPDKVEKLQKDVTEIKMAVGVSVSEKTTNAPGYYSTARKGMPE